MLSGKDVFIMGSYGKSLSDNDHFVSENSKMQTNPDRSHVKHLLWMVFAASRGGQNRIRIIFALKRSPLNTHQLTKELGLNYRAIQHHLGVLEKNNLVSHLGQNYGTNYFPSTFLEENMKAFDEIVLNLSRGKHERKGVYSK